MDFLSYFALAILIFVVVILSYGMIAIHDIPYHMALKRNHPHADAIHAAGWISLFTLHAIWPFLWIWRPLITRRVATPESPGIKPIRPMRRDPTQPHG
jgi:hypothetical protein